MFDYICEQCGQGTVKAVRLENYTATIDGIPFVVPVAVVGICDECKAKHFDSRERERWTAQARKERAKGSQFLTPEEINSLRKHLGLNRVEFSRLIGCSRQSLYAWEATERQIPQSRTADLLFKLLRESAMRGPIDVVEFLLEETRAAGLPVPHVSIGGGKPVGVAHKRDSGSPNAIEVEPSEKRFVRLFPQTSQPPGFSPCLTEVA